MAKQKKAGDAPAETHDSLEEEIRALAYQLYCEGGYQNGHDVEHWVEAERQVLSRKKQTLRRAA